MTLPQIAIQARIWGLENLNERYTGIFDEAYSCGYAGVESRISLLEDLDRLKAYLAAKPLKLVGLHANLSKFDSQSDDSLDLDALLEKMNVLGTEYLIVSFSKQKEYGRWFELAARVTETCVRQNVKFCYHNHAGELESPSFFDELTGSYGVKLAADLAWVWKAGRDPVEFIDRYASFIQYVHVKDTLASGEWKELGNGDIDLPQVLQRLSGLNLPWWTVEQDDTDRNPSESARISRNYLRKYFEMDHLGRADRF